MQLKYTLLAATGLLAGSAIAYTVSHPDRRAVLTQSVASTVAFLPVLSVKAEEEESDGFVTTESGLRYKILKEGTGAIPQAGQTVKAHYTGTSRSYST